MVIQRTTPYFCSRPSVFAALQPVQGYFPPPSRQSFKEQPIAPEVGLQPPARTGNKYRTSSSRGWPPALQSGVFLRLSRQSQLCGWTMGSLLTPSLRSRDVYRPGRVGLRHRARKYQHQHHPPPLPAPWWARPLDVRRLGDRHQHHPSHARLWPTCTCAARIQSPHRSCL